MVLQAPCQHNFCLGCFNKWVAQGKKTCPTCRSGFPAKFAANPRINTALASAIRMAKLGVQRPSNNKVFEVSRATKGLFMRKYNEHVTCSVHCFVVRHQPIITRFTQVKSATDIPPAILISVG